MVGDIEKGGNGRGTKNGNQNRSAGKFSETSGKDECNPGFGSEQKKNTDGRGKRDDKKSGPHNSVGTADVNGTVRLEIICKGDESFRGCDFGIDDIQFRTIFFAAPTISASPSTLIAPGDQVVLTAFGGASYFWSTGETTQSITVNPCVTTTYTVNVSSGVAGCEGQSAIITVNVSSPFASFTFSPDPYPCVGTSITFTNFSNGYSASTTYSWDFGDNTTGSGLNPLHSYSSPGTYTVILTVTDGCGTSSASLAINITPSTSTYNANCCSSNHTFTFDQTTGGPIIITAPLSNPQHWTGQNYYIRGTVTIMPGAKLVIDGNSVIEFDPYSKIVVSPGAILEVQNSTLTGLQTCGTMWQGIEVWGNKTKTQTQIQIPATGQLWQGKVILNNSTVALAHNGVVLGRAQGSVYNINSGGGILLATNTAFTNCGYGVRFIPYPYVNNSRIVDCNFNSTTLPDPGYNAFNSYTYPNPANPRYGYANQNQRTYAFGLTFGVKFVQFKGNTFSNAEYGLIGINSSLRVVEDANNLGNRFNNMNVGETHANIFTSPFHANTIRNNTYTGPTIPIESWAGLGDQIINNRIPLGAFVGIGSVSSGAITINDNLIGGSTAPCLIGVSASNSGTMGGLIGFTTQGNIFTSCANGVWLNGSNSFLQVHCNQHFNGTNYQRNWGNFGPLATQGFFPITNDRGPAGNRFFPTAPTAKNELYSTVLFDYHSHNFDANASTTLDVIPTPSSISGNVFSNGNVVVEPYNLVSTSCDPGQPCSSCGGQMAQLDGTVSQLDAEKTGILNQLDGGQTQQLITAINSNMSSGQLQSLLLSNSPLSDQVLLAYIAKNGTPPGNFKNVVVPNSPVSKDVRPSLNAKIASMPPGIKNQIIAAQSDYSNRTVSVVDGELQSAIGKRQQVYNQQMDNYINRFETDSMMKDSVYALLIRQNTEASKEAIAASYLADENYPAASVAISALNPTTPDAASEKDFLILMYNIHSSGRDIFNMTPIEEQQVRTIAGLSNDCLARANARVILFVAFGEPLQLEINLNNARVAAPIDSTLGQGETFLGESYPNPATDEVNIECNVPDQTVAMLKIFDMNGRLLATKQLQSGKQVVTLSVHQWEAGVYMYELIVDDKIISYQKMVITNK